MVSVKRNLVAKSLFVTLLPKPNSPLMLLTTEEALAPAAAEKLAIFEEIRHTQTVIVSTPSGASLRNRQHLAACAAVE